VYRADPSPNGRGWPAPAGRVRGTVDISLISFISYPSLVGRGIRKNIPLILRSMSGATYG
jgi:hypothetical protein